MKKLLFYIPLMLLPMLASAIEIDGVFYTLNTEDLKATVTSNPNKYTGDVIILDKIIYDNIGYDVTSIDGIAFNNCTNLTSITIPGSIKSMGNSNGSNNVCFLGCSSLAAVHISDLAAWCSILFESSQCNPLYYAHHLYIDGKEVTSLIIPDDVTSIANYAFSGCSGLTSVAIPNSVTSIGQSAFSGCSGLTSVSIPGGVTSIRNYTFSGCSSLTSVSIPDGVTSIGIAAFSGCSSLTSVSIPEGVTSIGGYSFEECSSLTSVSIPEGVTSIGSNAFCGCSSLTSVSIPDGVTSIAYGAFRDCSDMTSVSIPDGVTSIGEAAFSGCSSLTSVSIPEGVTSIRSYSFYGCSSLTSVSIPDGVTSIGDYTFQNCSSLTSVRIPNSVTSIGEFAFYNCSQLTSVHISNVAAWCKINFDGPYSNPLYYAQHLYLDGKEVTSLIVPDDVTFIRIYAFFNCSGLTSVAIPNNVTSIGDYAFYGCSGITSLSIPEDLTTIKKSTFNGCSSLESITIPAKVKYIYEEAFANCTKLTEVIALPENPPSLHNNSFSNYNITLKAPENALEKYSTTDPWSNFSTFKTLTGEDLVKKKCEKPTISVIDGKLEFSCDTEDVKYHWSISTSNGSSGEGNSVPFTQTFVVSVYASKSGYDNSDVTTQEFSGSGLSGDVDGNGIVNVADHVKLSSIILDQNE